MKKNVYVRAQEIVRELPPLIAKVQKRDRKLAWSAGQRTDCDRVIEPHVENFRRDGRLANASRTRRRLLDDADGGVIHRDQVLSFEPVGVGLLDQDRCARLVECLDLVIGLLHQVDSTDLRV